jgi:4-diphosphocytidyl-2-C-methyl-D-erythritol kinase
MAAVIAEKPPVENVVFEDAFAKINLALHVTGQRQDGYHLIETLVTFADKGDRLVFRSSDMDRFTVDGPYSSHLVADSQTNLVVRARDLVRQDFLSRGFAAPAVAIHLTKNLPIASGIGGGSADAAATVRGLQRLWGCDLSAEALDSLALSLGADVPMCMAGRPLLARGIGDQIEAASDLPSFAMVLVNPLAGVSTPQVFRLLETKTNPPIAPFAAPSGSRQWLETICNLRNDLEAPARQLEPLITVVLEALGETGALLVRMSGSGATCFGIYADAPAAEEAALLLEKKHPDWYVQAVSTAGHQSHEPH